MPRREFKGAARPTHLGAGIGSGDTTITIDNASGWPTGGGNGPFYITLDRGLSTEEHCLVTSRTSTTLNSVTRGVDDTVAVAHAVGADGTVIHSHVAVDSNEANRHIFDTAQDEHTQYMLASGTRHDLTPRHSAGTVVPTAVPVATGTALSEGTGTNAARATHVHTIGTGSINSAGMFAAGVVDAAAIATDAIGTLELAPDSVTSVELAANSVGSSEIFADSVIAGKIGAAAVEAGDIAAGGVSATNQLANNIVTLAKIANEDPTAKGGTAFNNVTLGTGSAYNSYIEIGKLILGLAGFTLGAGGNVTGIIQVQLPFAAGSLGGIDGIFAGRGFDASASTGASGLGIILDTESVGKNIVTLGGGSWDNNFPWDWTDGDTFRGLYVYYTA